MGEGLVLKKERKSKEGNCSSPKLMNFLTYLLEGFPLFNKSSLGSHLSAHVSFPPSPH